MNIFIRELKANFRSLLIWSGIMILFIMIGTTKFQGYAENPELLAVFDSMPQALLNAFQFNAFNLTTITGFYGVMFTYFALLMTISAAMWGSDIISKEERDKTVEFALTLPVPRSKIVTAKALAALVNCIAFLLVTWGASLAFVARYQPDSEFYDFLLLLLVALFILQMVFLAVGILLGCAMKQYKRAGSLAVSIILGTYFLSVLSDLSEDLNFLKYVSPFKFFNPATLLHESRFDITFVLISLGIVVISIIGAYVTYSRRDLYI